MIARQFERVIKKRLPEKENEVTSKNLLSAELL